MKFLVDTNILTRIADPAHAMHQQALDAVTLLMQQGHKLHVVPQGLYEFWVVATRPESVNGLGKTAAEALSDLTNLKGLFLWLDDSPLVYGVWEGLVAETPVLGKNAHDARFVAAMSVHGLSHLLTFNTQDFRQYPGITVVAPADVVASSPANPGATKP
jgi:predicted nucleic acid-binding protein